MSSNPYMDDAKLADGVKATGLLDLIRYMIWMRGRPVRTIRKNAHAVVERCFPA